MDLRAERFNAQERKKKSNKMFVTLKDFIV